MGRLPAPIKRWGALEGDRGAWVGGSGRRGPLWASPPQADELDGEIDLRSCTDVTEYAVQRNYGFQIHVSRRAAGVPWAG